jgi:hypothetical protein
MPDPDYDTLHPCFAWVRDYLRKVAPPGRLPGRQHIDPVDLRNVLSLINLVDVQRDAGVLRFRFRLVGTTQTAVAGREITGRFVEDAVLPELLDRILGNMRKVAEEKAPIYDRFPMPHPGRKYIDTERIYFPLAADGETVDMLLILNGYPDNPEFMPRVGHFLP